MDPAIFSDQFFKDAANRDFCNQEQLAQNKQFLSHTISTLLSANFSQDQLKAILQTMKKALCDLIDCEDAVRRERQLSPRPSVSEGMPLKQIIGNVLELARKNNVDFRIQSARSKKFQTLVHKVKPLAKGSTVPGATLLKPGSWVEATGMEFEIEGKKFSDHVYMFYFHNESSYWDDWSTKSDQYGVPYRSSYSFSDYIKNVVAPSLTAEQKSALIEKCSKIIEYYEDPELEPLRVLFDDQGRMLVRGDALNEWRAELTVEHPKSFREFLRARRPVSDESFQYVQGRDTPFIFVLTADKQLYISMKQKGSVQHTSLSRGRAVLSVGILAVDPSGGILRIEGHSGHYHPTLLNMMNMLEFLQNNNVNIDRLTVELFLTPGVKRGPGTLMSPGTIMNWVKQERATLIEHISEKDSAFSAETAKKMSYAELHQYAQRLEKKAFV